MKTQEIMNIPEQAPKRLDGRKPVRNLSYGNWRSTRSYRLYVCCCDSHCTHRKVHHVDFVKEKKNNE